MFAQSTVSALFLGRFQTVLYSTTNLLIDRLKAAHSVDAEPTHGLVLGVVSGCPPLAQDRQGRASPTLEPDPRIPRNPISEYTKDKRAIFIAGVILSQVFKSLGSIALELFASSPRAEISLTDTSPTPIWPLVCLRHG